MVAFALRGKDPISHCFQSTVSRVDLTIFQELDTDVLPDKEIHLTNYTSCYMILMQIIQILRKTVHLTGSKIISD